MAETVDNIVLQHLIKILAEQAASRERDAEIMARLGMIESATNPPTMRKSSRTATASTSSKNALSASSADWN